MKNILIIVGVIFFVLAKAGVDIRGPLSFLVFFIGIGLTFSMMFGVGSAGSNPFGTLMTVLIIGGIIGEVIIPSLYSGSNHQIQVIKPGISVNWGAMVLSAVMVLLTACGALFASTPYKHIIRFGILPLSIIALNYFAWPVTKYVLLITVVSATCWVAYRVILPKKITPARNIRAGQFRNN